LTLAPAANLNRLEEVLIITQIANDSLLADTNEAPQRAAEMLAKRLPTIKKSPDAAPNAEVAPAEKEKKAAPAPSVPVPTKDLTDKQVKQVTPENKEEQPAR